MINYPTNPVTWIRQNVIMIGGPIMAAMPGQRTLVEDDAAPPRYSEAGCTVHVKQFFYADDEQSDEDDEVDPDWEAEKAVRARLTTYPCPPTGCRWKGIAGPTIVSPPPTIFLAAHELSLDGVSTMNAYLLPWLSDGITWMHLDFGCRFFFTDTMNGCTFFIGGTPQAPVVGHSNVGNAAIRTAKTAEQLQYMQGYTDSGLALTYRSYPKTNYISASEAEGRVQEGFPVPVGTQANIVGFNNGLEDGWQFWSQSYMLYGDYEQRRLFTDIRVRQLFP